MLDRRFMAPGNLIARGAQGGGDLVALGGTRRPAAQENRQDALLLDAGALGQLLVVDALFLAQLLDALGGFHRGLPSTASGVAFGWRVAGGGGRALFSRHPPPESNPARHANP